MIHAIVAITITLLATIARAADAPLVIRGDEQSHVDLAKPYGNLAPLAGVANIQVFRASRNASDPDDANGWTYHHHVDLACWKGRLYLAWDSCEKDEDVWPSRELYATSSDGMKWSKPAELFPQGLSTHLRMFFFLAPNGRMLTIAGLRLSHEPLTERKKGPLIVREILADHSLGEVYLLRPPAESKADTPPMFDTAPDAGFAEACHQLLANKPFLEQSDYGMLLGDRRMKWHDVNTWPADEPSREHFENRFGKAMAFYHRKDGALVAVMKWGWVLVSRDEGETWSSPMRPPTLVSGMAKMWGQRTADGRYLLAYNPSLTERFPLVAVTGDDGITFGDMRVIHGELPPIRYPGLYKAVGPQYVRGVSVWSNDGSFPDRATWIAYSMSKEDIWMSRIPLAADAAAAASQPSAHRDGKNALLQSGWNIYTPLWAPVTVETMEGDESFLRLRDSDPADYSRAMFPVNGAASFRATFEVRAERASDFEIDIINRPAGIAGGLKLTSAGEIRGLGGNSFAALRHAPDKWLQVIIEVDAAAQVYSMTIDEVPVARDAKFMPNKQHVGFISFTTGSRPDQIAPDMDRPVDASTFDIRGMRISPLP